MEGVFRCSSLVQAPQLVEAGLGAHYLAFVKWCALRTIEQKFSLHINTLQGEEDISEKIILNKYQKIISKYEAIKSLKKQTSFYVHRIDDFFKNSFIDCGFKSIDLNDPFYNALTNGLERKDWLLVGQMFRRLVCMTPNVLPQAIMHIFGSLHRIGFAEYFLSDIRGDFPLVHVCNDEARLLVLPGLDGIKERLVFCPREDRVLIILICSYIVLDGVLEAVASPCYSADCMADAADIWVWARAQVRDIGNVMAVNPSFVEDKFWDTFFEKTIYRMSESLYMIKDKKLLKSSVDDSLKHALMLAKEITCPLKRGQTLLYFFNILIGIFFNKLRGDFWIDSFRACFEALKNCMLLMEPATEKAFRQKVSACLDIYNNQADKAVIALED